jgi:hypothetical protein
MPGRAHQCICKPLVNGFQQVEWQVGLLRESNTTCYAGVTAAESAGWSVQVVVEQLKLERSSCRHGRGPDPQGAASSI